LKGLHNAINRWQEGRDDDGFRDNTYHYHDVLEAYFFAGRITEEEYVTLLNENPLVDNPPKVVVATPELFKSIEFLATILSSDHPVHYPVRFTRALLLIYGFVDTSGRGFAGTFEECGQEGIEIDIGVWSVEIEKEHTGNWKELSNLVEHVKTRVEKGELKDTILFLHTDSSTVEGTVDKGNSKSKELFKLVCRLRKCQMKYSFTLYVIYVASTRMIYQGMDSLSRGVLNQGALATGSVRLYAPINLTALD